MAADPGAVWRLLRPYHRRCRRDRYRNLGGPGGQQRARYRPHNHEPAGRGRCRHPLLGAVMASRSDLLAGIRLALAVDVLVTLMAVILIRAGLNSACTWRA